MDKVEIKRLNHQGLGIGYINDKVTFILDALPGEEVLCEVIEEKPKYNIAKLVEIVKKSSERVEPFCPYFLVCGGCHLAHLSYEKTLEFKKEKVENIFHSFDILEIEVVENAKPLNYRNKITLKVKNSKIGFYAKNSHKLIEVGSCSLAKESINRVIDRLKCLGIKDGEIIIRANSNDEVLIIIKTKDKVNFRENDFVGVKLVGVILNNKVIYGVNFLYERLHNLLFKISFDAFFQVNYDVTDKLFTILDKNISSTNVVLDLYSGVGTLGIIASNKAKQVYSIEIVKNAVLDNIQNIKLNKRTNIYPLLGDAKKVLKEVRDSFDTIIIDPPRSGLDKNSLELLLNSKAQRIIYISCEPLTLKRDLSELTRKYEIEKFYILDIFSYTYHVESMVVLNKR